MTEMTFELRSAEFVAGVGAASFVAETVEEKTYLTLDHTRWEAMGRPSRLHVTVEVAPLADERPTS